jgi:predicted ATPase
MLTSFTVENYRAFAREQTIEIRPLTLFFGWNSGGKSALVRFLPLLVESIKADSQTISLAGEVGRGASWPELVCKATKRTSLKFGLHWAEMGPLTAKWEVDGDFAGAWQENKTIQITHSNNELTWETASPVSNGWTGFPSEAPTSNTGAVLADTLKSELHRALRELQNDVQWVGGVRARPPRFATYAGGNPPALKHDGSNAIEHLIAAQLRSINDPALEAIRAFFSALGEQLVLDNPMEGVCRVMLRPTQALDVMVNLCDTGEGYTQVLPVLVALARARFGGPRLLCLEQPELHLHTRAQAALAKILVQTALAGSKPALLVETHSEVLLTSVQLAIANGEISPDMVRVYWVESREDGTSDVLPVDFNDKGQPNDSTLASAFNEAVMLGRQLLAKQMAMRNKAAH